MKKIMIDSRNEKIIAFALVAVLLLIGTVGMASAAMGSTTSGGYGSDLTHGLVAYYPFNGDAKDKSGNGNHGAVYGATLTADRLGKPDSAYEFDGKDSRIKLNKNAMDGLDTFTVGLWVKTSDRGYKKTFISAANSDTSNVFLFRHDHGSIHVDLTDRHRWAEYKMSDTKINDGSWHYLAITRSGSMVKLYIDGEFDSEWDSAPAGKIDIEPNGLWLGGEQDCVGGRWDPNQQYKGIMDDIRIYNRALSETEIKELYNLYDGGDVATLPANCIYFNTGAWTNLSSVFINGTEIYGGTNNKYSGTAYMYLWLSFDSPQANISLRPCPEDIDPQAGEPNWGDRAGLAIEDIPSNELRSRLTADFVPYELRAELKGPYIYRTVVTAPDHGYHSSYIFSFDTSPNYAIGWGNVDAYDWLARVRVCNLG